MGHKKRVEALLENIDRNLQLTIDGAVPLTVIGYSETDNDGENDDWSPRPAVFDVRNADYAVMKDGEWVEHPDAAFLRLQQELAQAMRDRSQMVGEVHAWQAQALQAQEALARVHTELDQYKSFRGWLDEQIRQMRADNGQAMPWVRIQYMAVRDALLEHLGEAGDAAEPHEDGQGATNVSPGVDGAIASSSAQEQPDAYYASERFPLLDGDLMGFNRPRPRAVRDEPQA